MFSRLREHLGTAGLIVAIVALVAALGGAAIAANGGGKSSGDKATASAKKGRKGAQGPKGETGPQGPQGPAGANGRDGSSGLDGEEGAKGKDGKAGKNGVSIANSEFTGAKGSCTEGGTELTGSGSATYVCNGKQGIDGEPGDEGSPWTAGGTLPSGSTETGGWVMGNAAVKRSIVAPPVVSISWGETAISFPIPLAAALEPANVQSNPVGFPLESSTEVQKENCPGSVTEPKAAAGFFCVYTTELANTLSATPGVVKLSNGTANGTDVSGARVRLQAPTKGAEDPEYVYIKGAGSWAVTAP